jgi:hypothetical protein
LAKAIALPKLAIKRRRCAAPGPVQLQVLRPVVVANSGSYRMTR